ncbi:hypothetical protein [Streptomyces sp. NPDC002779]|uniref:hypothetical protein n=1 Tax=Streptomyces sp. NPDC002779 TaxID=3364664 RepID=UPI0036A15223
MAAADDAALLTCPGYQTVGWNPGLRLTPQPITTSGSTALGPCLDVAGEISSGSSSFTSKEELSCLSVLTTSPGRETITWNTGEKTTFSWTAAEATATNAAGALVVTISTDIESGKFAGQHVLYVITSASLDLLDCLSPQGLQGAAGPLDLTILP